jgi:hypothetical protein
MLLENFFIVKKRGDWVTSPRFERFKSPPALLRKLFGFSVDFEAIPSMI